MSHDVFVSYSSHDKPIADAVCSTLESRGIRCWIAPRDVLPGMSYGEALTEAIHSSRLMVLVLTSASNDSGQVMREVERAVSRGIPIIPFKVENVALSQPLEYFLGAVHWLDALSPPMEKHLQTLVETAQSFLSQRHDSGGRTSPKACYPGLVTGESGHKARSDSGQKAQTATAGKRRSALITGVLVAVIGLSSLGVFLLQHSGGLADQHSNGRAGTEAVPERGNPTGPETGKGSGSRPDAAKTEMGFASLFDGKTLAGWSLFNCEPDEWAVEDGKVVAVGMSAGGARAGIRWLGTDRDYSNFVLRFEFLQSPGSNSGVFLRQPPNNFATISDGVEIQLLDDDHARYEQLDPTNYTGAIYGVTAPVRGHLKPLGEWNAMEIRTEGPLVVVMLNGITVVADHLDQHPEMVSKHPGLGRLSGRIGLQSHDGRVEFRNIEIKEVK